MIPESHAPLCPKSLAEFELLIIFYDAHDALNMSVNADGCKCLHVPG